VVRADCAERTLWNLAVRPTQLGRLRIDRPFLNVVVRGNGTNNVEEVLAKFLGAAQSSTATTGVDVAIELVDGTIEVREELTNRKWQIVKLGGVVNVPATNNELLTVDLQGAVAFADGPRPFNIKLNYRDAAAAGAPSAPQGDAAIDLGALPLDLVGSLTRRYLPGFQFAGIARATRGKFDATTRSDDGRRRSAFAHAFRRRRPLLRGDELRLAQIDLPPKASLLGRRLQIDQLAVSATSLRWRLN
jgi:hypothetical protein